MKFKISFLISTVLCIYLSACQKETGIDDNVPPVPTADSNYLDKIYDVYDDGSGADTQEIVTIHYDNLKRVISMNDSLITSTGMDHFMSFYYTYNGTDTLPVKSVQILTEGSMGASFDTLTTYHFYDAQKRKSSDSTIIAMNYLPTPSYTIKRVVTHFSYDASKLYGETSSVYILPAGTTEFSKDTATLNGNGDIIQNKKYKFNGSVYILNTTSNYIYDNHPQPFSKLSSFMAHRQFPNGETLNYEYISKNNIISQDETTIDPSYHFFFNVAHTYNAAGYPTISMYDAGIDEVLHYTYKSL